MEKMASIMQKLRDNPPAELAGHKVVKVTDYKKPEETGLPAANVLIYSLETVLPLWCVPPALSRRSRPISPLWARIWLKHRHRRMLWLLPSSRS